MTLTDTPAFLSNTLIAIAAAALAMVVPMGIDLFGPPMQLGLFATV